MTASATGEAVAHDAGSDPFPLTRAQVGIWLAEQAEQGGRVRCIAEYFDIPGAIDVEAFRAAWCRTFAETDALRITVVETDDTLSQVIRTAYEPRIAVIDYRKEADAREAAVAWMTEDVARPFDLDGDIHTVVLFRIADGRYLWYQKCHHVAMDGYSGAMFAQRVCEHYAALIAGRPVEGARFGRLSELVEEDIAYTESDQHDLDRAYWRDLLEGYRPPSRLSNAVPDAVPGHRRVSAVLSTQEYADLRRVHGRSLPPLIIAAYGMYHAMLTGTDDVLLGLPVASRKGRTARRTPGMMSNVVPVRLRLASDLAFRKLVGDVSRQVRESLNHQRYRIEELRRDLRLGLDEQLFPGPVVNIMAFPVDYTLAGLKMVAENLSNGPTNDLALAVYDRYDGRGVRLDLDGDTRYYAERELRAHLDGFVELLRAVGAEPDMSVVLPSPRPVADRTRTARGSEPARTARPGTRGRPAGGRERLVAELFAEVLGLPEVGVDESFFEIGGDSIIAIAFAARAREAGLPIVLRQLFVGQTPAAIAAAIGDVETVPAPTTAVSARPTPAVKRLAAMGDAIGPFHQSVLVRAPAGLDLPRLVRLLRTNVDRHQMLRSRLMPGADGTMDIAAPGTVDVEPFVRRFDATGVADREWTGLVAEETMAAARRLAPRSGVMLQAVWFDRGPQPGRVLLVVHGLVMDAWSWRILLRDLESDWDAMRAGRDSVQAPSRAGFPSWSAQLEAAAANPDRLAELPHWLKTLSGTEPLLGGRLLDGALDTAPADGRLAVRLDRDTAVALRRVAPEALHTRVEEVLLSALILAIGEWRSRGDFAEKADTVLIDLVRDGRPEPTPDSDLSRALGNFDATVPVRVPTGNLEWRDVVGGGAALVEFVLATKDCLRAVPDRGDGFGILRFLNRSTAESLECCAKAQISFTVRDHGEGSQDRDWSVSPEVHALGEQRDPSLSFGYALLFEVDVYDRAGETEILPIIRWPLGLMAQGELSEIADLWQAALRGVATAVAAVRTARHSPTDMTMGGLSQQEIDELEAELEGWA